MKYKIFNNKIIDKGLILLMLLSLCIFITIEIRNKGKVENALPQQDMTVADATIKAAGNDDEQLETILKYYSSDFSKDIYKKFFVKNIGQDLKYRNTSFSYGLISVDEKGKKTYKYPSRTIYPVINVERVDIYNDYKGKALDDDKKCIKLTVEIKNTTDEDIYYEYDGKMLGIIKDNYCFETVADTDMHYKAYDLEQDYMFFKSVYDDNSNEIELFPYDEGEVPEDNKGSLFLIPANSIRTYYDYFVIDKDWIDSEKLAYGEDGLVREKLNGSVRYSARSFRIMLFPNAE